MPDKKIECVAYRKENGDLMCIHGTPLLFPTEMNVPQCAAVPATLIIHEPDPPAPVWQGPPLPPNCDWAKIDTGRLHVRMTLSLYMFWDDMVEHERKFVRARMEKEWSALTPKGPMLPAHYDAIMAWRTFDVKEAK